MPHKAITPEMFTDITFRRKDLADFAVRRYRIYTNKDSFVLITAENAKAALEASGIKNPQRVLHDSMYLDNVMKPDPDYIFIPKTEKMLIENSSPLFESATDAPDIPPTAADGTDASPGEASLSSEDVDKLLNN